MPAWGLALSGGNGVSSMGLLSASSCFGFWPSFGLPVFGSAGLPACSAKLLSTSFSFPGWLSAGLVSFWRGGCPHSPQDSCLSSPQPAASLSSCLLFPFVSRGCPQPCPHRQLRCLLAARFETGDLPRLHHSSLAEPKQLEALVVPRLGDSNLLLPIHPH